MPLRQWFFFFFHKSLSRLLLIRSRSLHPVLFSFYIYLFFCAKRKGPSGRRRGNTVWRQGVFYSLNTREMRDITGDSFTVQFEIFDDRKKNSNVNRYYNIRVSLPPPFIPLILCFYLSSFYNRFF